MTDNNLVNTKEVDYLEEDKSIKGQNYALLSFISPEDVIVNKEAYFFNQFLDNFGKDMKTLLDGIKSKYPDSKELVETISSNHSYIFDAKELNEQYNFFKSSKYTELENSYHRDNNFVTSMRGIKVRGVFDTIEEARNRSEFLKRFDDKFNIYIAQVGCWCPWSPNPDALENQEYSETQLNTLMKQYKQNMDEKDVIFDERKKANIDSAASAVANSKKATTDLSDIKESIEQVDTWTAAKEAAKATETIEESNDIIDDTVQ
jgi:hypothetical protein